MGERGPSALGVASRLENDDRLVAGESARRAHEPPSVPDVLHVDQDAARLLVFSQVVDEVREVDVDHAAHRGEHREPDVRAHRPVEHARAEGAALRDQSDVPGLGLDGEKRCVEPHGGADDAQAVGSHDAHRAVLEDVADPLLELGARGPRLREARRDDDGAAHARRGALCQHVGDGRCRRRDHREIDGAGNLADSRVGRQAEDRRVLGVDRVDRAPGRSHRVLHDRSADGSFGLRGTDDGDRAGVEQRVHENTSVPKVPICDRFTPFGVPKAGL